MSRTHRRGAATSGAKGKTVAWPWRSSAEIGGVAVAQRSLGSWWVGLGYDTRVLTGEPIVTYRIQRIQ
jgi:hypothetical protein